MRRAILYFLLAGYLFFGQQRVRADAVTYGITPVSGGYLYSFTLINTGSTGGDLYDLLLRIPTPISNIDVSTIGAPPFWGDASGGFLSYGPIDLATSFIDWSAEIGAELPVGSSLDGFSFRSSVLIQGPIQFSLNGEESFADATAVPEPASALLLAMGAIGAIALRRKRQDVA